MPEDVIVVEFRRLGVDFVLIVDKCLSRRADDDGTASHAGADTDFGNCAGCC